MKTRRRTARLQAVGSLAMLLIGLGFLGYYFATVSPAVDQYYAGISCTEMRNLAPQYFAGELNPNMKRRVEEHLAQCHRCHDLYEKMQTHARSVPKTSVETSGRHYVLNIRPAASPFLTLPPVISVAGF